MKKNNIYFILLLFFISCKSQSQNYKVIHSSDEKTQTVHYFNSKNEEYARSYKKNEDSLTFSRNGDNLIVKEYHFNNQENKRKFSGKIEYINYYSAISDISSEGDIRYANEFPLNNFGFINKDKNFEDIAKENCLVVKSGLYEKCEFTLSNTDQLQYLPDNSRITSVRLVNKNKLLQMIEIKAKYFDTNFDYKRNYYYKGTKIEKILTSIKDNSSEKIVEDKFLIEKQKP